MVNLNKAKVMTNMDRLNNGDFNSHATKKFTPHNSGSCRTEGIDFVKLTRDRAMSEWWAIVYD